MKFNAIFFSQIINHGVKEEVLHKMKAAVAAFFELPPEEKKKYAKTENEIQGYGQNFVMSEQQKLDWSDMIYLITVPPENRNFKFWPLTLPGFKYVYSFLMHINNHLYNREICNTPGSSNIDQVVELLAGIYLISK